MLIQLTSIVVASISSSVKYLGITRFYIFGGWLNSPKCSFWGVLAIRGRFFLVFSRFTSPVSTEFWGVGKCAGRRRVDAFNRWQARNGASRLHNFSHLTEGRKLAFSRARGPPRTHRNCTTLHYHPGAKLAICAGAGRIVSGAPRPPRRGRAL